MALRLLALVQTQTPRWSGSPRPGVHVASSSASGSVSAGPSRASVGVVPGAGQPVRAMDIGLLINMLLPVCPLSLVF